MTLCNSFSSIKIPTKLNPTILIILFLFTFNSFYAQSTGSITGKVVDADFGEVLIGANVLVVGTTTGAAADINGDYLIQNLKPGTYDLAFSVIGFAKKIVKGVKVNVGTVTKIDVVLETETIQTEEVVVEATLLLDTEAGLLIKRQKSNSVSDAISSEMISRTGSSDAADAVKKVVGASIVDGKYVYVRGLGERYSSTQLNGTELPSSDPNKKAFQLDLLPTSLLDNITTIKTFTPNKPGNFSGGIVDIGTKTFPEKFTFKISLKPSFSSDANYNDDFLGYSGGNKDWLGFDDGTREIPEIFKDPNLEIPTEVEARFNPEKAQLLDKVSKAFSETMNNKRESVPFNNNFSIAIGDEFKLAGNKFGYFASLTYKRSYNYYADGEVGRYSLPNAQSQFLNPEYISKDAKGSSEANLGGLINLAYNFSSNHQIGGNIFYSNSGISESRYQVAAWPHQFGDDENVTVYNRAISWLERNIITGQVRGEHYFEALAKLKADWTVALGQTNQDEPDRRFIFSYERIRPSRGDTTYTIQGSNFSDPSRYFRSLTDNNNTYKVDFSLPLESISSKLKFGGYYQTKDRDFKERIFTYKTVNSVFNELNGNIDEYFSHDNAGIISQNDAGTRFTFGNTINDRSKDRNNYSGNQTVGATYLMAEFPITKKLKAVGGIRFETTELDVISKDETLENGSIHENDWLHSANLIYNLTSNMNLRAAATKTLARPTFRELAPYSSKEFINDITLQGNPELERTLIDNYDLRWEWFMRPGEIFAVSLFHKTMKNPIEIGYAKGSTAANQIVQFTNVDKAEIDGVEFELRLRLDNFTDLLSNFQLGGNVSLVSSKIDIPEVELEARRAVDLDISSTRDLQGQSPYLVNVDLSYINQDWGTTASLSYNTFGERLSKVSANLIPDVYEQPSDNLDFILSQEINDFITIKSAVKNILDSPFKEVYRHNDKDYTYAKYNKGMSFSIGATWNL
ncbi:MAG: TonB-dependent receptor [Melioribacteraceae bacterium]|nr:TonB-dependent receptor [Melioribacteraceae bacterium]